MSAFRTAVIGILAAPSPSPTPGGIQNPLDGVRPDMSVLGEAFQSSWVRAAGALWALMLAAAALYLGAAFVTMAQAKQTGNHHMMSEATSTVKTRLAALGGLVLLPVIVGAVVVAFG